MESIFFVGRFHFTVKNKTNSEIEKNIEFVSKFSVHGKKKVF